MDMFFRRVLITLSGVALLGAASACKNNTTLPTPEFTTDTFNGTLPPGGAKTHNFTVSYGFAATSATVTVSSLSDSVTGAPLTTTVGVGFGNIAFDQSCQLANTATTATATIGTPNGPVPVSQGVYCVQIFDAGTLTTLGVSANYVLKVEHY
jgi:hypothetical protein